MKPILCLAFLLAYSVGSAQSLETTDPDRLKINTQDILNFWVAYDQLATGKTTADSLTILDQYYLKKATRGF
ncbi:MAG: hypothetical protein EOO39_44235, partial [Cytophagaceae bacterium]